MLVSCNVLIAAAPGGGLHPAGVLHERLVRSHSVTGRAIQSVHVRSN